MPVSKYEENRNHGDIKEKVYTNRQHRSQNTKII